MREVDTRRGVVALSLSLSWILVLVPRGISRVEGKVVYAYGFIVLIDTPGIEYGGEATTHYTASGYRLIPSATYHISHKPFEFEFKLSPRH